VGSHLLRGDSLLPDCNDFPWFSAAPVSAVFNVEPWGCEGLRWPDLDVDLHMASIQNPELYPLISQVAPVLPAVMEVATAMYDGDDVAPYTGYKPRQWPWVALVRSTIWIHPNTSSMCLISSGVLSAES